MNIYFGAEHLDSIIDPTGMFTCPGVNDAMFYYGVEYGSNPGGTDEVRIFDGCDRTIPVDIESVESLIKALEKTLVNYHAMKIAQEIEDNVKNPEYTQSV